VDGCVNSVTIVNVVLPSIRRGTGFAVASHSAWWIVVGLRARRIRHRRADDRTLGGRHRGADRAPVRRRRV